MPTTSSPSLRVAFVARAATVAAVLIAVAVLPLSSCTPKPTLAGLDRKVHATSLVEFDRWWRSEQAAANHVSVATITRWLDASPGRLDSAAARARTWDVSTDLCSFAPNSGPVFDFRLPCIRHDFAWRNLKRLQRLHGGGIDTAARRRGANRVFLADMDGRCALRPAIQRASCRAVARTYYAAVTVVS